jgi:hypothetical protein
MNDDSSIRQCWWYVCLIRPLTAVPGTQTAAAAAARGAAEARFACAKNGQCAADAARGRTTRQQAVFAVGRGRFRHERRQQRHVSVFVSKLLFVLLLLVLLLEPKATRLVRGKLRAPQ